MAARSRPPVNSIGSQMWGPIGQAVFGFSGSAIVNLKTRGCIKDVTAISATQAIVRFSSQQRFYTISAVCDPGGTQAGFMSLDVTASTYTASQFQLQGIGVNPTTGLGPPLVSVTVFGFIHRNAKIYGGPSGIIDVIGMSSFGTDTGSSISRLRKAGVISGVNYVSTGQFDVLMSPTPKGFYTVAGMASSDNANASFFGFSAAAGLPLANKFTGQTVGISPLTGRNCQIVNTIIFGQRPPYMRGGLNGVPLGCIGGAIFGFNTAFAVVQKQVWGCVQSVTWQGTANTAQINLWPQQPFYTWMCHGSSDASNATFVGWAATTLVGATPTTIVLQPDGVSPLTARAPGLLVATIYGPLKQPTPL